MVSRSGLDKHPNILQKIPYGDGFERRTAQQILYSDWRVSFSEFFSVITGRFVVYGRFLW